MRIGLLFNHAEIVGGGELSFLDLAAALKARGFAPLAIAPAKGEVSEALEKNGVETAFLPLPCLRGTGLLRWPGAIANAAALFRREKLDIVHANGARCMLVAGPAARRAKLPCLWHVRVLERDKCLDRLRARFAAAIIANSKAAAATLKTTGIFNKPIHVVYNGFKLDELARCEPVNLASEFALKNRPVILSAGRLTPWKRFEDLLTACRILADQDKPVSCVLAGSALPLENAYEARLKRMAGDLRLENVVFAGWRKDVPALMKSADAFVLPSKAEPFGRVLVEAWACGTPVVATNAGGPSELVNNGVDGLLIPPEDPPAMAQAIRRIIEQPGLAGQLRAAGIARADAFSLDTHTKQIIKIYQSLLK